MALTDANGAVVERVKYDPYGQPICTRTSDSDVTTASHFANPWLFQGQRFCSETGIYYFKNRDQNTMLGRFTQRDPGGYRDGMNIYAAYFVPSYLDPLGLAQTAPVSVTLGLTGLSAEDAAGILLLLGGATEIVLNPPRPGVRPVPPGTIHPPRGTPVTPAVPKPEPEPVPPPTQPQPKPQPVGPSPFVIQDTQPEPTEIFIPVCCVNKNCDPEDGKRHYYHYSATLLELSRLGLLEFAVGEFTETGKIEIALMCKANAFGNTPPYDHDWERSHVGRCTDADIEPGECCGPLK